MKRKRILNSIAIMIGPISGVGQKRKLATVNRPSTFFDGIQSWDTSHVNKAKALSNSSK